MEDACARVIEIVGVNDVAEIFKAMLSTTRSSGFKKAADAFLTRHAGLKMNNRELAHNIKLDGNPLLPLMIAVFLRANGKDMEQGVNDDLVANEKALRDELVRISKLEIALRANMPSTTIDDIIRLLQEGREALEHKLSKIAASESTTWLSNYNNRLVDEMREERQAHGSTRLELERTQAELQRQINSRKALETENAMLQREKGLLVAFVEEAFGKQRLRRVLDSFQYIN
eukprot:g1470.t1